MGRPVGKGMAVSIWRVESCLARHGCSKHMDCARWRNECGDAQLHTDRVFRKIRKRREVRRQEDPPHVNLHVHDRQCAVGIYIPTSCACLARHSNTNHCKGPAPGGRVQFYSTAFDKTRGSIAAVSTRGKPAGILPPD